MYKLREYCNDDLDEILKLFYETVHRVNRFDYDDEELDAWAPKEPNTAKWKYDLENSYTVVAVDDDGKIVGFGNLVRYGYLDRLYVHKDHQNQGIATLICGHFEELCKQNEKRSIIVEASITAQRFFERRHYKTVKKQKVYRNGCWLTNYVMEKSFTTIDDLTLSGD